MSAAWTLVSGPRRFEDAAEAARTLLADAPTGTRVSCRFAFEDGGPGSVALQPATPGPADNDDLPPVREAGGEDLASWRCRVAAALREIEAGRLTKVVLARAARLVSDRPVSPSALARRLLSAEPGCLVYAFDTPDNEAIVGATPERLVRRVGRRVQTMALAGSAPPDTPDRALLASPKDRREHAVVVEAICAALGRVADVTQPPPPRPLPLSHVKHIFTPIEATLREDVHVLALAGLLHPTPSMAGAPREAALAHIRASDPVPRGYYAGVVGWADAAGDGDLHVAIRCARISGNEVRLHAGAGIVAGSDADTEWAETEAKMRAMRSALGLT